jgi:RNA polymerase sigma-70 factor (sigma-E family)
MIATVGEGRERASASDPATAQVVADRDATLESLYRLRAPELIGLARLLLDDRGQAEEVVQEAFARTYEGWSRLRDQTDPLPYVRRAVVNLARGGLRRRITARAFRADRSARAASAETDALEVERRSEVLAAVRTLPRRQQECVVLRFYADLTTADIALALGISDGSVKQHLHRARSALEVVLSDEREQMQ